MATDTDRDRRSAANLFPIPCPIGLDLVGGGLALAMPLFDFFGRERHRRILQRDDYRFAKANRYWGLRLIVGTPLTHRAGGYLLPTAGKFCLSYNRDDQQYRLKKGRSLPTTKIAQWPEGLSDKDAVQRLETLCRGACSGIQDLSDDSRYKALRKALLARPEYRAVAPSFVAAQPNLEALLRYLRATKNR